MKKIATGSLIIFLFIQSSVFAQLYVDPAYNEQYRPQIHFSPKEKWMNDPNGLVYYDNTYHLFFQHYPDSTIWGPMHWGHAISKDLVHWQQLPIALYPDSLGYIYSGSIVVDSANTSGFGKNGKAPLVAIFTHSNPVIRKEGKNTYQYQSLAYSLDKGYTWIKYEGNPVLKNPGIKDFRDPKVSWYKPGSKWIMTLATKDRVTFYSSTDLKEWEKESEFGQELGAHGGVWECPDLLSFDMNGKKLWVLLVSINPGGPNGGSATQYFVGDFDGKRFTPFDNSTRWVDYGTDNYAGVTFFNTGDRKIFMGWMSNWQYANKVPTQSWRSAMTLPREMELRKENNNYYLVSNPVDELGKLKPDEVSFKNISVDMEIDLRKKLKIQNGRYQLSITSAQLQSFTIQFSNALGEKLVAGFDKNTNQYYVDRTMSGRIDFEKNFAKRMVAPRISNKAAMELKLVMDESSIEVFADDGLTVLTAIFFPQKTYDKINFRSDQSFVISRLKYSALKRIW
ncbi:glycoside hydrolase family 32 protein [Terrimonas alba]|uniref:glycoside hydrolase family 32 protein n=1 Tax=Terrimonas alba TaxID=3349636 RepID=UPI0035F2942B